MYERAGLKVAVKEMPDHIGSVAADLEEVSSLLEEVSKLDVKNT